MSTTSALTFDRWDFLGTRLLLGLITLVVSVFGLVVPIVRWVTGRPLTWQLQTGKTDELVTDQLVARPGVELAWPGTAEITIDDADAGTWLASILPGLLLTIATVVIVVALFRLLASIQAHQPFASAAVRSLRVIGSTLMVGGFLVTLAGSFANKAVLDAAVDVRGSEIFSLGLGPTLMIVAAGLVCAALAQAFAHGITLADDVEGLV